MLIFAHFLKPTKKGVKQASYIFFFLLTFFSFISISTRSFPLMLIALEGVSLISYYIAMAEKRYGALAASVKYFIMGTLGSVFLF